MFDATQTGRPKRSTEAVATPDERVSYLGLVDGDTSADWEAADLDNTLLASHRRRRMKAPATNDRDTTIAVRDGSLEPDGGGAGRDSDPVTSDLRLLKYMSVRDAALAAGVSRVSGGALQCRALFVAANLAETDK